MSGATWGERQSQKVAIYRSRATNMGNMPIQKLGDPYWISLIFTGALQFVLFVRWLYRRVRDDEMNRAFVHDMATNHLPHIYDLLLKLCEKQGIETDSQPPIRWVELSGSEKK